MAGSFKTNNRKPYNGDRRALVLAFDVGTTFSGVSYAFLDPGEVPKIHGVTRYPGQEHVTGNTKIPSLLYYDRNGRVVAAGAEAERGQVADEAEDEGWFKVELFKLRLRPRRMELDMNGMRFSPLPPGKSSEDVFGDFLAYLFSCTRKFIEDTHANGKNLWRAIEKDIHFVLSHPNGWEGAQQTRMRRAAISGGLISNTDEGKARIRFVTEGEASMHACILSGLAHDVLASGNGFIVADAGGGTLDVSSYILRGTHPLQIEEVAPPDCVFAGAVFVSRRCRVFLEEKLRTSKYGTPETLDHITKRFDETTKRLFRDKNDVQYIPFGSPLDRDTKVGIRTGQLRLAGAEVAELFEPSIQAAVASVRKQVELARGAIKAVWLVGGFAASPWLFSQLKHRLKPLGVTVNRPDNQTSKAVADGAIGFFCDHHVSARMSRYMYGVEYLREIDVNDEEHVTRSGRQLQLPSGPKYLPDAFDCILAKNVRVKESSVFSRKYYTEVTKLGTLSVFEIEIWCYRGGETIPKWIDRNSDNFGSLCYVRADLSRLSNSAAPKKGANGQTYWTVVFSIEIHFGLTEFKARMKWNEDGKTKYGPATIVFNEKGVRSDEDDDAYSVAGGDEPMAISPRRPYGSLLSHVSREPSTTTRSSRHRERDRDRGMHREHVHNPPAPALSGTGMSRSMSGQTDATSVETITREPSPPPAARPIVSSVSSSSRSRGKSRGLGSSAPSANVLESEPALERELEPPSLSVPSRAPSMHSRVPSAVGAPMSMHSRTPSTAAPPSVHSRTPSIAVSPSMHSRAPSAAAPPPMHSRTPSAAAAAPSVSHISRAPSAAVASSPVPSRAPSIAQVPSRAPSVAAVQSPVPSRTPSVLGRPSLSRAPSTGSRVPTVTRAPSARSGYGSRAPSQMAPVDEADLHVPTEPDLNGSAAEYYNSAPSGELDAVHSRPRSISPAPQADLDAVQSRTRSISPAPPVAEEPPAPPSKHGSWELPSVPEAPPHEEKKGWGFGSGWGWGGGKPADDATGPSAAPGGVPLETFEHAEEQFIPPAPGTDSWDQFAAPPPAPGGWNDELLPPVDSEPIAAPPEEPEPIAFEPEITAPPITKTSSKNSKGGKGKKGKGILKNGSAAAEEAEAKAKAEAEAEALAQAEHETREKADAEAEALAREQEEAEARAKAEEEELARKREEEEEAMSREMNAKNSKGGKNKKGKGILKNGSAAAEEAEAKAKAEAEAEALARAEFEAREKAEAEAEALAREQEEAEARAKAEEEELAKKREEDDAWARETNSKNSKGGKGKKGKGAMKNGSATSKAAEEAEAKAKAEAEAQEAYEKAEAEAQAKAKEDELNRQLEEEEARSREQAEAAEQARIQAEAEETARLNAEALARAEAEAQAAAEADAKAKAEEEAAAEAKADAEAEEAARTNAAAQAAEDEAGAGAATDAPAEPETALAAESAPAVDEEKTKLEAAVEKAEADVAKAEEEVDRRGAALAKIPKPKGKKKKGPTAPSAAEKAAERELAVAEKSLETAKDKLEKAKATLEAYVPPAAEDPPAFAPPPEEPAAAELAPPISKVSSTASGKGKKTNMFDFGAFGNDTREEGEEGDGDGEGEGEKMKEDDGLGLFGGGGSSWGFSTPFGGGKAGSKTAGRWGF